MFGVDAISFLILELVSLTLNISFFTSLVDGPVEKVGMFFLAVILDFIKVTALFKILKIRGKDTLRNTFFKWWFPGMLFLCTMSLSMMSSLFFATGSVAKTVVRIEQGRQNNVKLSSLQVDIARIDDELGSYKNREKELRDNSVRDIKSDLDTIEKQIQTKLNQQSEIGYKITERSEEMTSQIESLQAKRDSIKDKYNNALSKKFDSPFTKKIEFLEKRKAELNKEYEEMSSSLSVEDVFSKIGKDVFKTDTAGFMTKLFLFLAFILEVGITYTSDGAQVILNLKKTNENEVDKEIETIFVYLENLYKIKGERLNSDDQISKMSGIPLTKCHQIKNIIVKVKSGGKFIVECRRGGTFPIANYMEAKEAVSAQMKVFREDMKRSNFNLEV